MAEALRSAKSHIHIAGWHLSSDFELERGEQRTPLRDLLAGLAERVPVRVLMWGGSPAPVFTPTRRQVKRAREALVGDTAIQCTLDTREHPMHCHHEKLIVIDDATAFVGGIDLTELGGDRFDRNVHPLRDAVGWHDVASRLAGPVVSDVAAHFAFRWRELTGESLPEPPSQPPAGECSAQLVRTVPQKIYRSLPRGDYRILEAYLRALRSAKSLIYIENQFMWSTEIVEVLRDKLRHPPSDDFRLLVLLPVHANNGADVTRGQAAELADADRDGRFLACSLYAHDEDGRSVPVYVHAKVAVIDDAWITLGSANLNERSLFNDSEVNVISDDARLARETREQLWAEHLETSVAEIRARSAAHLIDKMWRPIATEQLERHEHGDPLTHRLMRLPSVSRRSRRLLGPLESFVVDG